MPYQFNTDLTVKQPQTSLADMVNIARGAQAYQQAQQINPLAVQQQQAQTQTSQIEAQQNQQKLDEMMAARDYLSNTSNYQDENGNIDTAKLNKDLMKIAPTTGAERINSLTGLVKAQSDATKSIRELTGDAKNRVGQMYGILGRAGINDPKVIFSGLEDIRKEFPDDKNLQRYIDSQEKLINFIPDGSKMNLSQSLLMRSNQLLNPAQQQEAFAPKAGSLDVGGAVKGTTLTPTGPLGEAPTIKVGGVLSGKTLAPQTAIDPVTGAVTVIGGGAGGNAGASRTTPASNAGSTANAGNVSNLTPIAPGATAGSMKANIDTGYNNYRASLDAQTNPNSKSGHIPSQLFNNQNILKLIKDPEVDTARIANYFSDPLKYNVLSAKEQDLAKFLEQRVQGMNPSSQMDLQSKHQAYGTTALKKEALNEIIRNEMGSLTTKDLQNRGRIVAAGDPNRPNGDAVNKFDQSFAVYSQDPMLMKYIGIVGEGKKAHLDQQDIADISKIFGRLPDKNAINALELKRQALIKLVNGGK